MAERQASAIGFSGENPSSRGFLRYACNSRIQIAPFFTVRLIASPFDVSIRSTHPMMF
jgi:hypothetical protein